MYMWHLQLYMSKTELLLTIPSLCSQILFPYSLPHLSKQQLYPFSDSNQKPEYHSWLFSFILHLVSKFMTLPSHCIQNLTITHLPHSNHSILTHHALSPGLLQEPHLFFLCPSYISLHHKPSQHTEALNNNHFIMLVDSAGQKFRKRHSGDCSFLPVPMISGAPARMAQWPEPGTAGSGRSASKVASLLPCLPSRLRCLKNRTSWDSGLNFHMSPL